MNDTFIIGYIIVSLLVIIFQYWYIKRLKKTLDFAIYSMKKFGTAMLADDPAKEVKGIDWEDEFKKFKQNY